MHFVWISCDFLWIAIDECDFMMGPGPSGGPRPTSQGRQFRVIPPPDCIDGCDFMMGPGPSGALGPAVKADNLGFMWGEELHGWM